MVKHIIFWKLKPELKAEKDKLIAELNHKFQDLIGKVDGLILAEVGANYNDGDYDMALYSKFTSREAEKGYQVHPEHMKIKNRVHEITAGRSCIDYDC